jgi:hypothetical protein
VRRLSRRYEQNPVELELIQGRTGQQEVAVVWRIERAAKSSELLSDYSRTWPSPRTTYLVVVSSRTPIVPRAWSFWVEVPISAPMPNS